LNTCLYCSGSWRPEASCNVTIRMPGRGGAGGCVAMSSDAARSISMLSFHLGDLYLPMPLSFVGVELLAMPDFSSSVIVEAEVDREKVLPRGARCVSLSSDSPYVSIVNWKSMRRCSVPRPACYCSNAPRHRRDRRACRAHRGRKV